MNKVLTRNMDNKMIAGVCSGLADYFGVDPTIMRLIFIAITLFTGGLGILLYLIAWIIVPEKGKVQK